ncbi:MAG: hypothetical protein ACYC6Y_13265 [Thermoguttaceae bacterium]
MPGPFRFIAVAGLTGAFLPFLGCGKPARPAAAPPAPVRQAPAASLPALGDYMPPLDDGRIEIAGPAGWELLPRKRDYVVLFKADSPDDYPLILVKAADASGSLTAENAAAFAKTLGPSAEPLVVGKWIGALQSKRGKEPGSINGILEQLLFTTVVGDRAYTFELRTRQGRVAEFQDTLFAVVAGLRQVGADAPAGGGGPAPDQAPPEGPKQGPKTDDKVMKELEEIFQQ